MAVEELSCYDPGAVSDVLVRQLAHILSASFKDPEGIVLRSVEKSDYLALNHDETGSVDSFLFFHNHLLREEKQSVPAWYAGMSCVAESAKGTGRISELYHAFRDKITSSPGADKAIVWATTATPTVFAYFGKLFKRIGPNTDGSYSEVSLGLCHSIRKHIGACEEVDHPFVIRNSTCWNQYSDHEVSRLVRLASKQGDDFYRRFNIDVSKNNRVLVIGKLSRAVEHQSKNTLTRTTSSQPPPIREYGQRVPA